MGIFYLGQRVKKSRGKNYVGLTGVVVAFDNDPGCLSDERMAVTVDTDCEGTNLLNGLTMVIKAGESAWTDPDLWDSILPDGLESNEEIAELFEPEPELVYV